MPLNSITEKLFYTSTGEGQKHNQRIIISALTENPICWKVSKIENHNPFGLQKVTLMQTDFNRATDYVNLETGEMFADYYSSTVEPIPETEEQEEHDTSALCSIECSNNYIKAGGSYKLFIASFKDSMDNDVTDVYESEITWKCYIDDEDITESGLVTFKAQDNNNSIKIKFANDKTYLEKKLKVVCKSGDITGSKELEIIAL